jgi:hypothetical protein
MKKIKMFLITSIFLALFSVAVFIPGKAYAKELDISSLVSMMTGVTLKVTPVEVSPNPQPSWFGIIYDTTFAEEAFPAFAQAECFAYLPCFKVEMVPTWSWLFNFLGSKDIKFPTFYASDLIPEMTPAYIEAYCGQTPLADFKRNWAVQIVAGESAYSYNINDVYCTQYKVAESEDGPYISEVSFKLGKIVGDTSNTSE